MEIYNASKIFESLSSEVRLSVFRLLTKYADTGLVAGEIAEKLNLPNTNLSFHLKALLHVNMITVEQEGRYLRYRANIDQMMDIVGFLTKECCGNSPEKCGIE